MKHIVFVLGSYYPRFSAVGFCAQRVIVELSGKYKISVLAVADEQAVEPRITLDGVDIYRVTTPDIETRVRLGRCLRVAKKTSDRLQLFLLRARTTLRRLVTPVTIDRGLVEAYTRQLQQIPDVDVIVPLVFPFESVVAALEYASASNVKLIPYLFDNFVESRSLHVLTAARRLKQNRHLQLEAEMINRSALILSMHPLEAHFRTHFGSIVDQKIRFLEHPLLSRKPEQQVLENTLVKMVYTGALIKNVHEPGHMLDLLGTLDIGMPFHADFYVMGNAASQVKSKTTQFGGNIVNHGQVSKRDADMAVAQSTILLNIGEVQGKQISSKIFEYMSAGKPVVHFVYKAGDVVSKILNRYPLALCLLQEENKIDENREKLRKFVLANSGKSMDFEEVAACFPEALPETTAMTFIEAIEMRDEVPALSPRSTPLA